MFDLDRIKKLCGVRAFAKASMIRESEIEGLTEKDGRLVATVRGTLPYSVELWVEGTRKAAWSCNCPQGEDGKFCKHAGRGRTHVARRRASGVGEASGEDRK